MSWISAQADVTLRGWGIRGGWAGGARGLLLGALLAGSADARAAEEVWAHGITEPVKDVTMAFPLIGVVGTRPLEEGAAVKQGQVIIELDKRLEELEVERRRLVWELSRNELNRVKSLAERSAISVSREEVDKKQAEFDVARVEHALAEETVRRRMLMSPVDGTIVQFFKDVGEKCEEQQPVVRVVDTRRCYLVVNLEARAGMAFVTGQAVKLEVDTGRGLTAVDGRVSYVAPVVDGASGLLKIKAIFENPGGKLRPGVTGRIRLPEEPSVP